MWTSITWQVLDLVFPDKLIKYSCLQSHEMINENILFKHFVNAPCFVPNPDE